MAGKEYPRVKQLRTFPIVLLAAILLYAPAGIAQEETLRDLYIEAVKNSEKIKHAEENLYIAKMGRMKAWSVLMPRVTAFGAYNRYSEAKFTVSGALSQPNEADNWGVRADESFSLSIRKLDALKISGQLVVKSDFDLENTKSDFILSVATAIMTRSKRKKRSKSRRPMWSG